MEPLWESADPWWEPPPDPEWHGPERHDSLAEPPVLGLAAPGLGDGRLLRNRSNAHSQLVTLGFGDETSASGPFVSVTTLSVPRMPAPLVVAPARDALAAERDRMFYRASVDEPDPVDAQTTSGRLRVEGQFVTVRVRREGSLWAAQARVPAHLVPLGLGLHRHITTVVSRGVPLPSIDLNLVADLRPFWAARDAWLRARRQAGSRPSEPPSWPTRAAGLSALKGLINSALGGHPPRPQQRRGPRHPVAELRREWVAALHTQMHYARQSREEASRAIAAMVSQLRELSLRVRWWDDAGADAIAESIRYTVFDSVVPSQRAQLLWTWAMGDPSRHAAWLAEWERWNAQRAGTGR
jgi:hypothetical protein